MSEWKDYILEDVVEKFIDYRGKTPTKTTFGIPLMTAKIVKKGRLLEPTEFIANEDYESWMTRGFPEINDVLLTTEAPLGEVALIKNKNVALGQRLITLQTKKDLCDSIFLKYYFQSNEGQSILQSRASGTTVEGIKSAELKKIEISLPNLLDQRAIASVLTSLDDKIDLLQRQNSTLEAIAKTLFRQWFVEEAKEDWEEGSLADLAQFYNGKSRPKEEVGTIPIYGGNGVLGYTNISNYSEKSIIIGRVGAYCGSLYFENKEIWVSDNALLVKAKIERTTYFLLYLLKTLDLNSMAEGSSHPLLTQTLLKSIVITIPPIAKIENFDFQLEQIMQKKESNNNQIRTLTALRDTLLPKLMSGEVRVEM